jgi:hypothetical protein
MRKLILTIVSLLALSASAANAEDVSKLYGGNIRSILEIYDKTLVSEDRRLLESLVEGMTIGLLWGNAMLKERGQPLLYCQPDKFVITGNVMIEMMRRAMKDNPKWGAFPLGMMAMATLQRTFPCK